MPFANQQVLSLVIMVSWFVLRFYDNQARLCCGRARRSTAHGKGLPSWPFSCSFLLFQILQRQKAADNWGDRKSVV